MTPPDRRFTREPQDFTRPPEAPSSGRPYDPDQTLRRFADLAVFAVRCAEIVGTGHDAFVAPAAWQPRAAATYLIIEIATVAEKLHPRVREHFADVPWRRIRAMRNIAAHRYDDVNDEIVWTVLETFVPDLVAQLGLPTDPDTAITLPAELAAVPAQPESRRQRATDGDGRT